MAAIVPKLLVVGGNGFLGEYNSTYHQKVSADRVGSAVCKAAIAKGWEVSSVRQVPPGLLIPAHKRYELIM